MDNFVWPHHIKFDDTGADINEARRVWLIRRGSLGHGGGVIADFLEFMDAYAKELESHRKSQQGDPSAFRESA